MWCSGVWHIGTNILVEPGISIFRLRRKELLYPEGGGGRFLQIVCVYLPNLMESHPTTLSSTFPLHITCLGLIYMSTKVTELRIKFLIIYAVKFLTSQNTWWCPSIETVQHWEFIAVVCSGVTLTGGFGDK